MPLGAPVWRYLARITGQLKVPHRQKLNSLTLGPLYYPLGAAAVILQRGWKCVLSQALLHWGESLAVCYNRGWTDSCSRQRIKCLWANGLHVHCDPGRQRLCPDGLSELSSLECHGYSTAWS